MVNTRIRGLLLLAALLLPAPLVAQRSPAGALVAADLARADSAASLGFAEGFAAALADDALYLHPGAPILRGRDAIRAFLHTQAATPVRWQPLRAVVSRDGGAGATFGVTAAGAASGAPVMGRYIAYWRHGAEGWRVAAVMLTTPPPGPAGDPAQLPVFRADTSAEGARGEAERADRAFAADAGVRGAGPAFQAAAAPNAMTFGGGGTLRMGPDEILAGFGGPPSQWRWQPVASGAAASGDLAFTVGESEISGETPNGRETSYGKYLTIWQRQPDGSWKYLTDGGNARPAR